MRNTGRSVTQRLQTCNTYIRTIRGQSRSMRRFCAAVRRRRRDATMRRFLRWSKWEGSCRY
ncbi:hypothetical protein IWW43_005761, partial [Coemansia sp. RSA 1935]